MAMVDLESVGKRYGVVEAVRDLDLSIGSGEFLVLLGRSGCGETTTLRKIAGLESISTGTLRIAGTPMNNVEPKDRGVAKMLQNYAPCTHKTVYDNMAMALKLQRRPRDEIDRRMRSSAEMLGLTEFLGRKPAALSGG